MAGSMEGRRACGGARRRGTQGRAGVSGREDLVARGGSHGGAGQNLPGEWGAKQAGARAMCWRTCSRYASDAACFFISVHMRP